MDKTMRFERQKNIPGWDQEILKNSRVGCIGCGPISTRLSTGLAAIGVGNLVLFGPTTKKVKDIPVYRNNFWFENADPDKDYAMEFLAEQLKKVNPEICTVEIVDTGERRKIDSRDTRPLDILIDATNDRRSKSAALGYSNSSTVPFVSMSSNFHMMDIWFYFPDAVDKLLKQEIEPIIRESPNGALYSRSEQGLFTSLICAGTGLEEIRKIIMPRSVDESIYEVRSTEENFPSSWPKIVIPELDTAIHVDFPAGIHYDLRLYHRGSDKIETENIDASMMRLLEGKKLLVGGAGSTAGFFVPEVARLGASLAVVDYDFAEVLNLNRQVHLCEYDGKTPMLKSEALISLAKKVAHMMEQNGSSFLAIDKKVGVNFDSELDDILRNSDFPANTVSDFDYLISCFDNYAARVMLNRLAVKYRKPLLDMSTGWEGFSPNGSVYFYIPDKVHCLQCKFGGISHDNSVKEQAVSRLRKEYTSDYMWDMLLAIPELNVIFENERIKGLLGIQYEYCSLDGYVVRDSELERAMDEKNIDRIITAVERDNILMYCTGDGGRNFSNYTVYFSGELATPAEREKLWNYFEKAKIEQLSAVARAELMRQEFNGRIVLVKSPPDSDAHTGLGCGGNADRSLDAVIMPNMIMPGVAIGELLLREYLSTRYEPKILFYNGGTIHFERSSVDSRVSLSVQDRIKQSYAEDRKNAKIFAKKNKSVPCKCGFM